MIITRRLPTPYHFTTYHFTYFHLSLAPFQLSHYIPTNHPWRKHSSVDLTTAAFFLSFSLIWFPIFYRLFFPSPPFRFNRTCANGRRWDATWIVMNEWWKGWGLRRYSIYVFLSGMVSEFAFLSEWWGWGNWGFLGGEGRWGVWKGVGMGTGDVGWMMSRFG